MGDVALGPAAPLAGTMPRTLAAAAAQYQTAARPGLESAKWKTVGQLGMGTDPPAHRNQGNGSKAVADPAPPAGLALLRPPAPAESGHASCMEGHAPRSGRGYGPGSSMQQEPDGEVVSRERAPAAGLGIDVVMAAMRQIMQETHAGEAAAAAAEARAAAAVLQARVAVLEQENAQLKKQLQQCQGLHGQQGAWAGGNLAARMAAQLAEEGAPPGAPALPRGPPAAVLGAAAQVGARMAAAAEIVKEMDRAGKLLKISGILEVVGEGEPLRDEVQGVLSATLKDHLGRAVRGNVVEAWRLGRTVPAAGARPRSVAFALQDGGQVDAVMRHKAQLKTLQLPHPVYVEPLLTKAEHARYRQALPEYRRLRAAAASGHGERVVFRRDQLMAVRVVEGNKTILVPLDASGRGAEAGTEMGPGAAVGTGGATQGEQPGGDGMAVDEADAVGVGQDGGGREGPDVRGEAQVGESGSVGAGGGDRGAGGRGPGDGVGQGGQQTQKT